MNNINRFFVFIISILLFSFTTEIKALDNQNFIYSIFVNNERINTENDCDLELVANDVVKVTGMAKPDDEVTIDFAQDQYSGEANEQGAWVILFSVPYLEDGDYNIKTNYPDKDGESILCSVKINSPNIDEDTSNKSFNSTLLYIFLGIIITSVIISVSFIFKRKKK